MSIVTCFLSRNPLKMLPVVREKFPAVLYGAGTVLALYAGILGEGSLSTIP